MGNFLTDGKPIEAGMTIGELYIIGRNTTKVNSNNTIYWDTVCSCGKEGTFKRNVIVNRGTCARHKGTVSKKLTDIKKVTSLSDFRGENLIGWVFGDLTVIEFSHTDGGDTPFWVVSCTCRPDTILMCSQDIKENLNCGIRHGKDKDAPSIVLDKYGSVRRYSEGIGREFTLTVPEFHKLMIGTCYYCGDENPDLKTNREKTVELYTCGIDRIDNAKGYTLENSRTCCGMCNKFKYTASEENFISRIKRIVAHQNNCHYDTPPKKWSDRELKDKYKDSIKTISREFLLTEQQVYDIIDEARCCYCGDDVSYGQSGEILQPLWLDRVDSSKTYTLDNVVACCSMCNVMKKHHSVDVFLNQVNKIYKNLILSGKI